MINPGLNDRLHFVIPIYADDGETITAYVHSAPISRDVFDAHFLLISKTFTAFHTEGLGFLGGPRVASLMLKKMAERMNDPAGAVSLMNEIRRLSNVLMRGANGWESLPFHDVTEQRMLSEDDLSEATNAIVFFIVASAMYRKNLLRPMLEGAATMWGAQISSLNFTAYTASVGTSTTAAVTPQIPVSSGVY
jgi:hypothetical protein